MRILIRLALALVVLGLAAAALVWFALRPPPSLALPERGVTLDGVTLINPGLESRARMRIVVSDDRISEIADAPTASPTAAVSPWAGHFVLPGLTDLHVHFPPAGLPGQSELFAFLFLYHGVTTVRDAGDVDGTATEPARRGVAEHRFPGPRIFACGPFLDGEPPIWRNSRKVVAEGDGRRAVAEIKAAGYECVKAYNELDASALAEIRAAAHESGLPVIGHVPRRVSYEDAQLDDVQHLIGIAPPPADPNTRFPAIMNQWTLLDEARIGHIVQVSLAKQIANTPTLVVSDRLLAMEHYDELLQTPDVKLLPRFYSEVVWSPREGLPILRHLSADDFAALRASVRPRLRMVNRLYQAGAKLHIGTDVQNPFVVPGISLHRELRFFEQAGIPLSAVWAIATRGPAETLGEPLFGRIAVGARADLLIFREDPTQSLDALDTLEAVIADGRLYPRAELDAQLARYQAWFGGRLYDTVATALVRRVLANLLTRS
jgi:imidazolonepropionase-like amidohydrolase